MSAHSPAPAPAEGSPADPFDAIRREDAPASRTLLDLCNNDTGRALLHRTFRLNIRDFTWSHAVQQLAAGVTVTSPCGPSGQREEHRLTFHPDGTITLVNHNGQHSSDLDLDALTALHTLSADDPAEQAALHTMRALGADVPECAKVALWLIGLQADPDSALARAGETFEVTTTWVGRHRYAPLLPLYAAVAWAQESFWPRGAGHRYLPHGITPHRLRTWCQAGWSVHDAIDWLGTGVSLPLAEQWRAAGRTDARSRRLAAVGEHPDTEDAWLQAGFAVGESDPWRARKEYGKIPRLEPDEAFYWHRHRVRPNSVGDFKALAVDEAAATAQSRKRWHTLPAALPGMDRAVPTLQRALEWTQAGVPSDLVLAWCGQFGTSDTALAWAREWGDIMTAFQFTSIAQWNLAHPHAPLLHADVARLQRIGFAVHAETMAKAAPFPNEALLRPVEMLVTGKRWHGRDLRRALTEAATAHVAHPQTGRWAEASALPQAILDGEWKRVHRILRGRWSEDNPASWGVVLDWLATNPTPPAPYRAVAAQA